VRTALVLGGGSSVWADADAAMDLCEFDGVLACNDASAAWPGKLDAAVSLHPEKFGLWMERRSRSGFPAPDRIIGHTEAKTSTVRMPAIAMEFADWRFPSQTDSGSSGLFVLKVALVDLGFDRAILCGIPMDRRFAHFFDASPWRADTSHRRGWTQAMHHIRGRARSMSGWTADQLGRPDQDWLAQAA
jgi:hypothetical protein